MLVPPTLKTPPTEITKTELQWANAPDPTIQLCLCLPILMNTGKLRLTWVKDGANSRAWKRTFSQELKTKRANWGNYWPPTHRSILLTVQPVKILAKKCIEEELNDYKAGIAATGMWEFWSPWYKLEVCHGTHYFEQ